MDLNVSICEIKFVGSFGGSMKDKIEVLKALADETRLSIIDMLSCGEMCVFDIMSKLDLTQPTISHHLKVLQRAGLVDYKKNGKWRIYFIENAVFNDISEFLKYISTSKEDCICNSSESLCLNEITKSVQ